MGRPYTQLLIANEQQYKPGIIFVLQLSWNRSLLGPGLRELAVSTWSLSIAESVTELRRESDENALWTPHCYWLEWSLYHELLVFGCNSTAFSEDLNMQYKFDLQQTPREESRKEFETDTTSSTQGDICTLRARLWDVLRDRLNPIGREFNTHNCVLCWPLKCSHLGDSC